MTAAIRPTAAATERPGDDDASVIRASRPDPELFAEIFDRHAPAVHGYLVRRVGVVLAEDLTSETFLVAFRQRDRYRQAQRQDQDQTRASARPWLLGIATNLLRRERRSEVRQYRAFARTGVDPATTGCGEADLVVARVTATAMTRQLAAALGKLSTAERDVLLLVAWGELSYADVATALGIPTGTVRSRLHAARRRMRAAIPDPGLDIMEVESS